MVPMAIRMERWKDGPDSYLDGMLDNLYPFYTLNFYPAILPDPKRSVIHNRAFKVPDVSDFSPGRPPAAPVKKQ